VKILYSTEVLRVKTIKKKAKDENGENAWPSQESIIESSDDFSSHYSTAELVLK